MNFLLVTTLVVASLMHKLVDCIKQDEQDYKLQLQTIFIGDGWHDMTGISIREDPSTDDWVTMKDLYKCDTQILNIDIGSSRLCQFFQCKVGVIVRSVINWNLLLYQQCALINPNYDDYVRCYYFTLVSVKKMKPWLLHILHSQQYLIVASLCQREWFLLKILNEITVLFDKLSWESVERIDDLVTIFQKWLDEINSKMAEECKIDKDVDDETDFRDSVKSCKLQHPQETATIMQIVESMNHLYVSKFSDMIFKQLKSLGFDYNKELMRTEYPVSRF